jgi:hypothetical protein
MHFFINLTGSDRINKYRDDLKQAVETPESKRTETDTSSLLDVDMTMQLSGDSADEFWMGSIGRTLKTTALV